MTNIGISYGFLHDILQNLISKWVPLSLDKDEENMVGDSFQKFDEHIKEQILNHRANINVEKRVQLDNFANLLRCTKIIRDSQLYQKVMFYLNTPFEEDMTNLISVSESFLL